MNNPTHAEIFGTTTNPCPSWCTLPTGHGYDSNDHTAEYRGHEHAIGFLNEPEPEGTGHLSAFVAVEALEKLATTPDGFRVELGRVHIALDANDADMTGPQAREVARLLLAAAELWDEVTGS